MKKKSEKKTWTAPKLSSLGSIEKITQGLEFSGSADSFLGFVKPSSNTGS